MLNYSTFFRLATNLFWRLQKGDNRKWQEQCVKVYLQIEKKTFYPKACTNPITWVNSSVILIIWNLHAKYWSNSAKQTNFMNRCKIVLRFKTERALVQNIRLQKVFDPITIWLIHLMRHTRMYVIFRQRLMLSQCL